MACARGVSRSFHRKAGIDGVGIGIGIGKIARTLTDDEVAGFHSGTNSYVVKARAFAKDCDKLSPNVPEPVTGRRSTCSKKKMGERPLVLVDQMSKRRLNATTAIAFTLDLSAPFLDHLTAISGIALLQEFDLCDSVTAE